MESSRNSVERTRESYLKVLGETLGWNSLKEPSKYSTKELEKNRGSRTWKVKNIRTGTGPWLSHQTYLQTAHGTNLRLSAFSDSLIPIVWVNGLGDWNCVWMCNKVLLSVWVSAGGDRIIASNTHKHSQAFHLFSLLVSSYNFFNLLFLPPLVQEK